MNKYFTGDRYEDNLMMTTILDEIDFYSGSERRGMVEKHGKDMGSMLYSATWRGPYLSPTKQRAYDEETGLWKTKIYETEPLLKEVFAEYASIYFPHFNYQQVQMNKNFKIKSHKDSLNCGESVLVSFGDYYGGLTCVLTDEETGKIDKYDPRESAVIFDGSKYTHWVEEFEGTRYSLVFFSNKYLLNRIAKRKQENALWSLSF